MMIYERSRVSGHTEHSQMHVGDRIERPTEYEGQWDTLSSR